MSGSWQAGPRGFTPTLLFDASLNGSETLWVERGGFLNQPHTHIYLKDFGSALVILGERGEADGQAWQVPNDMPCITQGELVKMFAEEAGVEPKMRGMGKFMLGMGGLFIPEARESLEMLYEFDQPYIIDSSKFVQTFGLRPTPMRRAISETVDWFKSHPEQN